jgi:hypothetical protein
MSRYEDQIGKAGQEHAAAALSRLGVRQVEKIGTPVKIIPRGKFGNQTTYQVIWGEKVAGDHHGILPGGRAVLAETKTIMDRNLQWSDMRPHQPEALSRHADLGGLALLVWVHSSGIHTMLWPVPGFSPGKSVSPEKAAALSAILEGVMLEVVR